MGESLTCVWRPSRTAQWNVACCRVQDGTLTRFNGEWKGTCRDGLRRYVRTRRHVGRSVATRPPRIGSLRSARARSGMWPSHGYGDSGGASIIELDGRCPSSASQGAGGRDAEQDAPRYPSRRLRRDPGRGATEPLPASAGRRPTQSPRSVIPGRRPMFLAVGRSVLGSR